MSLTFTQIQKEMVRGKNMLYVAYHHTAIVNNNLLVFYLRILLSYLITALKKKQETND